MNYRYKTPEESVKLLISAILIQAIKDYVRPRNFRVNTDFILVELRSEWMCFLTDYKSEVVAEKLEKYPDRIAEYLKRYEKEGAGSNGKSKTGNRIEFFGY